MNALIPGSQRHASAAVLQRDYQRLKDRLQSEGAGTSQADLKAQNTVLTGADLTPSGEEKACNFGDESSVSRMVGTIIDDRSTYLLSCISSKAAPTQLQRRRRTEGLRFSIRTMETFLFHQTRWLACCKALPIATGIQVYRSLAIWPLGKARVRPRVNLSNSGANRAITIRVKCDVRI